MTVTKSFGLTRRDVLAGGAASLALTSAFSAPRATAKDLSVASAQSLRDIAAKKGIAFGASFAVHELETDYGESYGGMYVRDAAILTSELEFKMASLRPSQNALDFTGAEKLVQFASSHNMGIRAHTLIWNDYQPDWILKLSPLEIERLIEMHISSCIDRYAGKIGIWDVVNEPIGPWHQNPGNLRGGPYYAALGEGYIAKSFRLARQMSATAKLVLNEAQTETANDNGEVFRKSLLNLLVRLKDAGTPIDAIGIQSHLKVTDPYDFPAYAAFLGKIADLGFDIHITELDVNDSGVKGNIAARDEAVAGLYEDYLSAVLQLPAVKIVQTWQLSDRTTWMRDPSLPERFGMRKKPRPLIYDDAFRAKPARDAIARALESAPKR